MLQSICNSIRSIGNSLQSIFLLIIRLYWGYQFFMGAIGKLSHFDTIAAYFQSLGVPLPHLSAAVTSCIELFGGALLFVGLFSRLTAIPLLCVLTVAYFTADGNSLIALSHFNPVPFFNATPFLFLYATLIIFCFGPGKISLDHWFDKENGMP